MTRVFVIRPFGSKIDSSGKLLDFDRVQAELINPVLQAKDLTGGDAGQIIEAGNVRTDMFSLILEDDLVICDITIHNANVFYELGIRHAFRKKHTILIKGEPVADSPPFDVRTDRYMSYNIDNPAADQAKLSDVIAATLASSHDTDSPIFTLLPTLQEVDVSAMQVVPNDFREEVARARAAKSQGWLRLLADDLRSRRFQWAGLQLVAKEQWNLKDYDGARTSLERIRDARRSDAAANLALVNVYERLYRKEQDIQLLTKSDQAIEQVLMDKSVTRPHRVEAQALKGRNQKTRWRHEFEQLPSIAERRAAAMNDALRVCYEAYRKAFYQDLNHSYSGVNALQMGHIFLALSADEGSPWKTTFESDSAAMAYRQKIEQEVEALHLLVPAAIEAELEQRAPNDPDRVWAEVCRADILFLTEHNLPRIVSRYRAAIPNDSLFAWDSARGQLELFAQLGIKAEQATAVIVALDQQFAKPLRPAAKPLHIVVFAGHRVDAPDRPERRFPADREARARDLIRATLSKLALDGNFQPLAMASAAPGGDILFHEVCDELGISSQLCLPMPAEDYGRVVFEDLDDWRSRYLRLQAARQPCLELSDREELPNWLQDAKTNHWERGNKWKIHMATTMGASKITLVALWDRKDTSNLSGGTAHMVQTARDTGRVEVEIIDTKNLFADALPKPLLVSMAISQV